MDELLNFSDGVFADYTNAAGDRLSVYIAYWMPGKMSHRLIASHTPDICWVGGGWVKTASSIKTDLSTKGEASTPPQPIPDGEARTFTANGNPEHVWFWHIVGNEAKSYATGHTAPWHAAFTDLFEKGFKPAPRAVFHPPLHKPPH